MHRYSFFLLDKALSICLASPLSFRLIIYSRHVVLLVTLRQSIFLWSQMAQSLVRIGWNSTTYLRDRCCNVEAPPQTLRINELFRGSGFNIE